MRYSYIIQQRRRVAFGGRKKISDMTAGQKILKTPDLLDYDLTDPFWYNKYADDIKRMNTEPEDEQPEWLNDEDLPF